MTKSLILLCGIAVSTLSGCHKMQQNLGMGYYIPDDKKYMPKMDESNSLLGQDQNANGIRDDIDQYIQNRFTSKEQIEGAQLLARGLQEPLRILATSKTQVEVANRRIENDTAFSTMLDTAYNIEYELPRYKLFKTLAYERCSFNNECLNYIGK